MNLIFSFFIFIFGLCIGSFLNVVVLRLEKGEGFVSGRSYCPHCKHNLAWFDLIPVASFLFLGGSCRYCSAKISWQYPLVEIATAAVFLLIFNSQFPIPIELIVIVTPWYHFNTRELGIRTPSRLVIAHKIITIISMLLVRQRPCHNAP